MLVNDELKPAWFYLSWTPQLLTKKNLRLKTDNKSTGEAQPANYLKGQTDYTSDVNL
jgi:hypothetical protein